MTRLRVIKLGGSLLGKPQLTDWLQVIQQHANGRIVIVPGGGHYADAVRTAQIEAGFDDDKAHRLATQAMRQVAHDLIDLAPALQFAASLDAIAPILTAGRIPVAVPVADWLAAKDIPASWDWSSDSFALWLAQRLDADLVLVKSVAPVEAVYSAGYLRQAGTIDQAFPQLLEQGSTEVRWLGAKQHAQFPDPGAGASVIAGSLSDCKTVAT